MNHAEAETVSSLVTLIYNRQFSAYLKALQDSKVPLEYKMTLNLYTLEAVKDLYPYLIGEYFVWRNKCYPLESIQDWYEFLPTEEQGKKYPFEHLFSSSESCLEYLSHNIHAWLLGFMLIREQQYSDYILAFRNSRLPLLSKFVLHNAILYAWEWDKNEPNDVDANSLDNDLKLLSYIEDNYGSVINALAE
jgi:hypothetical protein